jgi:hypothetical protein
VVVRNKYRLYACPTPGCPKIGAKGNRCRTHELELVPITVTRDKPQIPDALKTEDQKMAEMFPGIYGKDGIFGG